MKLRLLNLPVLTFCVSVITITACVQWIPPRPKMPVARTERLTDAEQIAGEIMAYLMPVVLGQAGAMENREMWATRGLDIPLDFQLVSKRMFGSIPLRVEMMVLDTNILGLLEVLYHYDRRLNLFKGRRTHDSLYPCVELMAIRLLLLQKLSQGEKIRMAALVRHKALFAPEDRDAMGAELAAMNLTAVEFRFLKAIFQSEPVFLRYLEHPFIVSMFRKIGVVEQDQITLAADLSSTYVVFGRNSRTNKSKKSVTIAILPSMNPLFETTTASTLRQATPTEEYVNRQEELKAAINQKIVQSGIPERMKRRLTFYTPHWPFTVHPENAARVIGQVCPDADFTVILLGKNVYRAIHIDPEIDTYPTVNRVYLDITDIKYQQADDEIEDIITAILPSVRPEMRDFGRD